MNRLLEESEEKIQYEYDFCGNRLSKKQWKKQENIETIFLEEKSWYNTKNQLFEPQTENETVLYTYDKQGNTIKEIGGEIDWTYFYNPVERAQSKGYEGVKKTSNGGVSFQGTQYMHNIEGRETIIRMEAQGSRARDFNLANSSFGFSETRTGYVWHHVDDYNVLGNTFTMELVQSSAHNASKPHAGTCAQYDAIHGASYNPAKKVGR